MDEQNLTEPQVKEQFYDDDNEEAQGFMDGYLEDEEVIECAECGAAIREDKVIREVQGESQLFCTKVCADEFEESA